MNIPPDTKAAIFDMDGLLIDSEPYWEKADKELFNRHGKKHTPAINKHVMGMKPKEIVAYWKKEYDFDATKDELLSQRLELLYKYLLENLSLMEGADTLLLNLKKRRIPMAIATSGHTKERAREILEKLNIDSFMKAVVSGDDVKNGKPAPDIFLKAAALLKVDPKDCLVFEDAPNGVVSAKAAGMRVYGVNKDKALAKKLEKAGADSVYSSLAQTS